MSGEHPFSSRIVSPAKCNEKPWDLWISEIGHLSPRPDDAFAAPAAAEGAGGAARRLDAHPYKGGERRYRRAGLHRLRHDAMPLHGLFPQNDTLGAAVCHMCGAVVKCSAAYRHLRDAHSAAEPLPPPPPPSANALRSRSRHKKEPPPPSPVDLLPLKRETSPAHPATPPLARIALPTPDLYLEEATSAPGEVQVCVESGELPVVSIQDTEELPLGENLTDDIFAIMNSEGIQSADDITNSADWKNIIRDIGNLQDLNFTQPTELIATPEPYAPLAPFGLAEGEAPRPPPEPAPRAPPAPATPGKSRSKAGKTKFNLREYDPNKHCGVVTLENAKPCTRSLTCKAHALSLRRLVEGRAKSFDALLAEHRASREAGAAAAAAAAGAPVPPPPPPAPAPAPPPPLPPPPALELSALNGLTAEQQVDDIYASLLGVEEPPDAAPSHAEAGAEARRAEGEVCWYAAWPRPLALCTYNASHAGGAVALGKRYATVRSNIKSSLSRSQCKTSASNDFYCGPNSLTLSKSVHMNASKSNKPEVRKLIVTCGEGGGRVQQTLSELFGEARHALNGHVAPAGKARAPLKRGKGPAPLELGFLDPLLADEKC